MCHFLESFICILLLFLRDIGHTTLTRVKRSCIQYIICSTSILLVLKLHIYAFNIHLLSEFFLIHLYNYCYCMCGATNACFCHLYKNLTKLIDENFANIQTGFEQGWITKYLIRSILTIYPRDNFFHPERNNLENLM